MFIVRTCPQIYNKMRIRNNKNRIVSSSCSYFRPSSYLIAPSVVLVDSSVVLPVVSKGDEEADPAQRRVVQHKVHPAPRRFVVDSLECCVVCVRLFCRGVAWTVDRRNKAQVSQFQGSFNVQIVIVPTRAYLLHGVCVCASGGQ